MFARRVGSNRGRAVPAGRLGGVERQVGIGEEVRRVAGMLRIEREAEARPGRDDPPADRHRRVQGVQDAVRQGAEAALAIRSGLVPVHDDDELVAAEARHEVAGVDGAAQAPGDLLEQRVAGIVAQRIVDLLERIEIEEDEPDPGPVRRRPVQGGIEGRLEERAVREPGEDVVVGREADLLLDGLAAGDVDETGDEAADSLDLNRFDREQDIPVLTRQDGDAGLVVADRAVPVEQLLHPEPLGPRNEVAGAIVGQRVPIAHAEEPVAGIVGADDLAVAGMRDHDGHRHGAEHRLEQGAALGQFAVDPAFRLGRGPFEAPDPVRADHEQHGGAVDQPADEQQAECRRRQRQGHQVASEQNDGADHARTHGPGEAGGQHEHVGGRRHQGREQRDLGMRRTEVARRRHGRALPGHRDPLKTREGSRPVQQNQAENGEHDDAEPGCQDRCEAVRAGKARIVEEEEQVERGGEDEDQPGMTDRLGKPLRLERGFPLR